MPSKLKQTVLAASLAATPACAWVSTHSHKQHRKMLSTRTGYVSSTQKRASGFSDVMCRNADAILHPVQHSSVDGTAEVFNGKMKELQRELLSALNDQKDGLLDAMASKNEHMHVLVLPGFATCTEDYTKEGSLKDSIAACSSVWEKDQIHVLPVKRWDWGRIVVNGVTDKDFRENRATPDRDAYCWYLQRVADEVRRIEAETQAKYGDDAKAKILMVGHSAGGWLGRAALGYGALANDNKQVDADILPCSDCDISIDLNNILGLVTLGSPHTATFKGQDTTGGALAATNRDFPGAFFGDRMMYISTASNAVSGEDDLFVRQSYDSLTTDGKVHGDGIVPTQIAHMDGATQVNLVGAYHFTGHAGGEWYGSEGMVQEWLQVVHQRVGQKYDALAMN